jgi:hypothetical protein
VEIVEGTVFCANVMILHPFSHYMIVIFHPKYTEHGHFTNWVGSSSTGVFSALPKTLNTPLHIKLCPVYLWARDNATYFTHIWGSMNFSFSWRRRLYQRVKMTKRGILEEWGSCN